MKKLPHETLAQKKQKLLERQILLARAIKDTAFKEDRARRKSRNRLAYLFGQVVVDWVETKPQDRKAIIDSIVSNVPEEKRELARRLIKEFEATQTPFSIQAGESDAAREKPKSGSDNTSLLPFDQ